MTQEYEDYTDEFGITAPLPTTDGQRRLPPEGFPTGPEVGQLLPDFELPAADGTLVVNHAIPAPNNAMLKRLFLSGMDEYYTEPIVIADDVQHFEL